MQTIMRSHSAISLGDGDAGIADQQIWHPLRHRIVPKPMSQVKIVGR
jgi:hypothetical protein